MKKAYGGRRAPWWIGCTVLAAVAYVAIAVISEKWWQWAIAAVWVFLAYTHVQGYRRYGRGHSDRR